MTELQKEFEATGYTSWINSDLYPDGKIYTQEYTQWLEKQVVALRQNAFYTAFKLLQQMYDERTELAKQGFESWQELQINSDSENALLRVMRLINERKANTVTPNPQPQQPTPCPDTQ